MKLLSLLIGLVLVAYLMSKQMSSNSQLDDISNIDQQNISAPKVPVTAKGLKEFETDINTFIENTAADRDKEIE